MPTRNFIVIIRFKAYETECVLSHTDISRRHIDYERQCNYKTCCAIDLLEYHRRWSQYQCQCINVIYKLCLWVSRNLHNLIIVVKSEYYKSLVILHLILLSHFMDLNTMLEISNVHFSALCTGGEKMDGRHSSLPPLCANEIGERLMLSSTKSQNNLKL